MSRYPTLLNTNTFIQLPFDTNLEDDVTLDRIYELSKLSFDNSTGNDNDLTLLRLASLVKKVLLSLKGATLTLAEVLKLWEVRITALCFITGKEIALSDTSSSEDVYILRSIKSIKNEVDILIPELYKINRLRKQQQQSPSQQQQQQQQQQPQHAKQIDSFPREVTDWFKFLLLKIKYGSSLMLVNEYYSHLWRFGGDLKLRHQLSFSIAAILIAKQEYMTVISLAESILLQKDANDNKFTDKWILLKTIVELLRINRDKLDPIEQELEEETQQGLIIKTMQNPTICFNKLSEVLKTIPPVYNDPESFPIPKETTIYGNGNDNENTEEELYNQLKRQVDEFEITGRILCALCANFEIDHSSENEQENEKKNEEEEEEEEEEDIDDKILQTVEMMKSKWGNNLTKYYGLE